MKIEGNLDIKISSEVFSRKVNWTKGIHRLELYQDVESANYFLFKDTAVIVISTKDLIENGFSRQDYSLPIKGLL
jgi:hypothetical protein